MKNETRDYILLLRNNGQHEECVETCKMLFDDVQETDIWFIYMQMSNSYRFLKQYKKSMECLQGAIRYNNTEIEYFQTLWQMGILLKYKGEKKKALKFYQKCADYYLSTNMMHQYADMLICIAYVVNNVKLVYDALEIYKSINVEDYVIENAYSSIEDIEAVLTNQLMVINK
jgi:tetratricopeptide (TPR) repeat protein